MHLCDQQKTMLKTTRGFEEMWPNIIVYYFTILKLNMGVSGAHWRYKKLFLIDSWYDLHCLL